MRTETPPLIRLSEYRVPDFLIDHVDLDFQLEGTATRVAATLALRRNPAGDAGAALVLDGDELVLKGLSLDGVALPASAFTASPDKLTIPKVPDAPFRLTVETEVNPEANTKLMGLYRTKGIYCTQCEADGFRRITYFLDRPDVMSIYRVRMEADKAEAPVLLCNGNPVEAGDCGNGRHYAVWEDPFRKPCYLFALVAGRLDAYSDSHTTPSGRRVALNVYVEPGKAERAAYAMDSLIRSMKWDEDVFGREYDLDLFNIVAVSDFNMGAMENKGLNVFNDRYVLASSDTATDQDYHNIEAIVAHEYFHNWTGNRITCRDWFQLCLKEGLTVFRDQEFSSDMRSRAVERIANVQTLRATQFVEDAGPLAHPVRPQTYKEINNFYTATVYNKGSELIQMLRLLIGPAKFREGMDLYFARHDGEAATVEQFIQCFAEASSKDLGHFMRWYDQAGTPTLRVVQSHDAASDTWHFDFTQETEPTPGQPVKVPLVIPVRMGLLAEDGRVLAKDEVVVLDTPTLRKSFKGLGARPVPSLLRGFSAPVKLDIARESGDLYALAAHDSDPFNRWQAVQDVAIGILKASTAGLRTGKAPIQDARYAEAVRGLIAQSASDPAFAALAIALPSEADMAREIGTDVDPDAIGRAVDFLRTSVGKAVQAEAEAAYAALSAPVTFSPDGASAGRRALRGQVLRYLVATDEAAGAKLAASQFETANNMTDRVNALSVLLSTEAPERDAALDAFAARYAEDALILDMWFGMHARIGGPSAPTRVRKLLDHPKFTLTTPNRVRALVGTFAHGNARGFHAVDGSGYDLVGEVIDALDSRNPQVAARLATAFRSWRTLEPVRRALAEATLRKLAAAPNRSRDLSDILERSLA